ncbi:thioredoxin family protein [Providencia stuartii]|nr:thioredoxin [Providencia stuartii MRSN 2154]AMG67300.1 thioredoxin [Providencia stuartii]EDU61010.1 thioredoxin [Providencia stuartii ATCC 25827]MBS7784501.1 thioredoxin family protein [Providencia thailandensis]QPN40185.1 thioredoxin family protein [Providencia sp. 2.29]SST04034.1 thioredoxin [Acinetobacter baumannii]
MAHTMPIIKHLDQQSFTEALFNPEQQGQIAIIYFSASWCQPCKNMQPIFEQLPLYLDSSAINFGIVDIAQSPTLAPMYGIKSVPSIALFNDSRLVAIVAGEVSLQHAITKIRSALPID